MLQRFRYVYARVDELPNGMDSFKLSRRIATVEHSLIDRLQPATNTAGRIPGQPSIHLPWSDVGGMGSLHPTRVRQILAVVLKRPEATIRAALDADSMLARSGLTTLERFGTSVTAGGATTSTFQLGFALSCNELRDGQQELPASAPASSKSMSLDSPPRSMHGAGSQVLALVTQCGMRHAGLNSAIPPAQRHQLSGALFSVSASKRGVARSPATWP